MEVGENGNPGHRALRYVEKDSKKGNESVTHQNLQWVDCIAPRMVPLAQNFRIAICPSVPVRKHLLV